MVRNIFSLFQNVDKKNIHAKIENTGTSKLDSRSTNYPEVLKLVAVGRERVTIITLCDSIVRQLKTRDFHRI